MKQWVRSKSSSVRGKRPTDLRCDKDCPSESYTYIWVNRECHIRELKSTKEPSLTDWSRRCLQCLQTDTCCPQHSAVGFRRRVSYNPAITTRKPSCRWHTARFLLSWPTRSLKVTGKHVILQRTCDFPTVFHLTIIPLSRDTATIGRKSPTFTPTCIDAPFPLRVIPSEFGFVLATKR